MESSSRPLLRAGIGLIRDAGPVSSQQITAAVIGPVGAALLPRSGLSTRIAEDDGLSLQRSNTDDRDVSVALRSDTATQGGWEQQMLAQAAVIPLGLPCLS